MSLVFEVCCTIPPPHLDSKSFSLSSYIFSHFAAVLPRKTDFTLKMRCIHHMIPNRYINPSSGFYSWLFAPDHGGNRTTKLCLGTYLTPLVMTVRKTSKSYTLTVAYYQGSKVTSAEQSALEAVVFTDVSHSGTLLGYDTPYL